MNQDNIDIQEVLQETEQKKKDEKYILSKKGKALLNKFKIIKKIYHVNSRILR